MSDHDETPSRTMMAMKAVREATPPWYQVAIGAALMGVAVWHALTQAHSRVDWIVDGILFATGAFAAIPLTAERIVRELRDVVPFLPPPSDPPGDDR